MNPFFDADHVCIGQDVGEGVAEMSDGPGVKVGPVAFGFGIQIYPGNDSTQDSRMFPIRGPLTADTIPRPMSHESWRSYKKTRRSSIDEPNGCRYTLTFPARFVWKRGCESMNSVGRSMKGPHAWRV